MSMSLDVIIWGGTGNFKVLCELLGQEHRVLGYFDNDPGMAKEYQGIPLLGGDNDLLPWLSERKNGSIAHVVSIGHGKGEDRLRVHDRLVAAGSLPLNAVHRTSFVAGNASLGEGAQVYAMASVCVDVTMGKCCLINTRASIDHECVLEDGVTVGPGAVLAGMVNVGRCADIYTGAVVLPRVTIGEGAVIGAGAVVREDVEPYTVMVGVPARPIRRLIR